MLLLLIPMGIYNMSDGDLPTASEKIGMHVQQPLENKQGEKEEVSRGTFLLFSYLYFIQGVIIGLIGTMPYIYPTLPDVDTMALFNSITLPYSFKFLIAPFLQKFTLIQYGKRKTWIIISQSSAATVLFIASFYTAQESAKLFAIFCFVIQIWMVVQNIALHSLIVKEITDAHESSMIQSFAETAGILFGGLVLLKMTSRQFAQSIGRATPITNPQTILIIIVIIIFIPVLLIHFLFRERVLQSEKRGSSFSFCRVIKCYSVFIDPKTSYFRFCIVVLLYSQGLNFFASLYDYKLVEAGFSRDTSNTIGNIAIMPIILLTFWFGRWSQIVGGNRNALMLCTSLMTLIFFYVLVIFPTDLLSIAILTFLSGLLDAWRFYSMGFFINSFPLHALSGMYITVLGSYANFGRLTFIHTELCGKYGWKTLSLMGLILQGIIVAFTPRLFRWYETGDLSLPKQMEEKQESTQGYAQMNDIN